MLPPMMFMFMFTFMFRLMAVANAPLAGPVFGDLWKRGPSGDISGDAVLLADADIPDALLAAAAAAAIAISCVTSVFLFTAISSAHLSLPTPPP